MNRLNPGDSWRKFMEEEIASARCVFLFLSPDYFQSAYTLFELVSVCECAELGKSLIFPLRMVAAMTNYQWTNANNYFFDDNNKGMVNELARLLGYDQNQDNREKIWPRIDAAWKNTIHPRLEIIKGTLESDNADTLLRQFLAETKEAIDTSIGNSISDLHKYLKNR